MEEFEPSAYEPPPMTDELMYQMIFSMEDQANTYYFDLKDGVPVQKELIPGRDPADQLNRRYIPLPSWSPADGFRIMEKFVSSLRNPVFREQLREALAQGKGVFRSFKNVLKQEPAIERLWFYFKERELKRIIYIWYEQLSESSYLTSLGEPEEDVTELILSDFVLTEERERWRSHITEIARERLDSEFAGVEPPLGILLADEYRETWDVFEDDWLMIFVESPLEEFVGFIGACPLYPVEDMLVYAVRHLYVEPRFRGLGVFKLLLDHLCERALEHGAVRVIVELSGKAATVAPALIHRGFVPISERFSLDLERWEKEMRSGDGSDYL